MPTLVKSVEELKKLSNVEGGEAFYILLNHSLRSSKHITWDEPSKTFCINAEIDDTHQDLSEQDLATKTNIVEAIEKRAFFKYGEKTSLVDSVIDTINCYVDTNEISNKDRQELTDLLEGIFSE